jgi:signal peptidase I
MDKYEVYSPKRKKKRNALIAKVIKIILVSLVLYLVVSHLLITSLNVESVSMNPAISAGERIFASPIPYGIFIPFSPDRIAGAQKPDRGDIVVIEPPYIGENNFFVSFFEPIVNFFSFQSASMYNDFTGKRLTENSVKRIIAVPGDTVRVDNFVAFIKPKAGFSFFPENDIIKKSYRPAKNDEYMLPGWDSSFPFSGNMKETTLGENEYFVLGDNRTESNDSRSWGPIQLSRIKTKVVLRYWPLNKIAAF